MRLRLYHHHDGARIAYRESGTGPPLILLHSLGLSHREWEPVVEPLSARFRVILPDLPLHGDSEDRARHSYSGDWMTEVIAGFCAEVGGPHPAIVGHGLGAGLALRATISGSLAPSRLVLSGNRLHRPAPFAKRMAVWRMLTRLGAIPGVDRLLSHAAVAVFRPSLGKKLSVQRNPETADLIRHALSDVGGNAHRARAWAKFVRHWQLAAPQRDLLDAYPSLQLPILLLWAEEDPGSPLVAAIEARALLPDGQLRTLPGTGFLIAYDDPVAVARELLAFCG
jgi:pimeloyl-ACP methyl ester carboxylesterase